MSTVSFDLAVFDKSAATFLKVGERLDKLVDKLDRLDRKRAEPKIDVDTARANRQLDHTRRKVDTLASGFSGSVIKVVALGRALGTLTAPVALAGMVPTLASIATAAAQASGALLLLPAAAGAAGLAVGTLATGLAGLKEAFDPPTAVTSSVNAIAQATKAADRAAVQGAEAVRAARQSVADAMTNGARRVQAAEQSLARAQVSAKDAQDALNRAREDAVERIEDLRLALSGAALDEEAAVIALQRAQERLAEAREAGTAGLDLQEVELGVRQAAQSLAEVRERYGDVRQEAGRANRAGVDGAEDVVAAQRQVVEATEGVRDAQTDLVDAQRQAARDVADAQRALSQAQRQAALAQEDAADAMARASERLSTAAPPELAKSAQGFVDAIKALGPAWTALRLDVQERLFAGLAGHVSILGATYLPMLGEAMGGVADSVNRGATSVAEFFELPATAADMKTTLAHMRESMDNLAAAARPLAQAWLDITTVGATFLPGMTKQFSGMAEAFAQFIRDARESGQLEQWIRDGLEVLKQLGRVAADVGGILVGVFKAAGSGADGTLGPLSVLLDKVNEWVHSFEGQLTLRTFFEAASDVIKALAPILAAAGRIIGTIVAPGLAAMAKALAPGIEAVVLALGDALGELVRSGALTKLAEATSLWLIALAPLLPDLATLAADLLVILAEHVIDMMPHMDDLIRAFMDLLREITPVLPELLTLISLLIRLAATVLPWFIAQVDMVTAVVRFAKDRFADFKAMTEALAESAKNIVGPQVEALAGVIHRVRDAFVDGKNVISGVWDELQQNTTSKLGDIIKTVRDGVNKIIGAWNWVAEKLNLPQIPLLADVRGEPGGGRGGSFLEFMAGGGPVRGGKPGKDSVPIMGMPDEFMWSTKAVKNVGGVHVVNAMHEAARQGRSLFEIIYGGDPSQPGIAYMADGGAVTRVQNFGRGQAGKPYIWAAAGPRGYDCSGLASALTNVALGRSNPFVRLFSTGSFTPSSGAGYFRPGLNSAFSVGVVRGNPGHMSTTVGGLNIEATPPVVRVGPGARGADHSSFNMRFSLPQVGGEFISGGGGGGGFFDLGGLVRRAFALSFDAPGFGGGTAAFLQALSNAVMNKMLRQLPGFGAGGVVPGPYGTPRLATVHGGEAYAGMGWEQRLARAISAQRGTVSETHYHLHTNRQESTVRTEFERMQLVYSVS